MIEVVRTPAELRRQVTRWRAQGERVALVPTMGALHEGHLSLVDVARAARRERRERDRARKEKACRAERVVVSIFVNELQFAPHEDFAAYPRDEPADLHAAEARGAHLVYAPDRADMFPDGFATRIHVGGVSEGLESWERPDFFDGVATTVAKLLLQCAPDIAVFGEKDYQQLLVVRQLTRDLNLPVSIIAAPTIRDAHGLALSSRNAYLSAQQTETARQLYTTLRDTAERIAEEGNIPTLLQDAETRLLDAGFDKVSYLALRRAQDLTPVNAFPLPDKAEARLLSAAWLGTTRLIDNIPVPPR